MSCVGREAYFMMRDRCKANHPSKVPVHVMYIIIYVHTYNGVGMIFFQQLLVNNITRR